MLRFASSLLLLLLLACPLQAQDTVKYDIARTHGVRLGVDVSRLMLPVLYKDGRIGLGFSADKQISKDKFLTAEAGFLSMDCQQHGYRYEMNGSYLRFGADMQIVRFRYPGSRDHVYGGVRYALGTFTHQASDIEVRSGYWPGGRLPDVASETLSSHWLEFVVGAKVELSPRFYLGAAVRGRKQLVKPVSERNLAPICVPGYGNGAERHTLDFSYSILYMFGPY